MMMKINKLVKLVICVACMLVLFFSGWIFGGYGIGNVICILIGLLLMTTLYSLLDDEDEEGFES